MIYEDISMELGKYRNHIAHVRNMVVEKYGGQV